MFYTLAQHHFMENLTTGLANEPKTSIPSLVLFNILLDGRESFVIAYDSSISGFA